MAQGKRIKLTPKARDDLKEIYRYGAIRYGEMVADAYLAQLFNAIEMLQQHKIGQQRAEVGENIFSLATLKHLIFFRLIHDEVLVVRVLHHSRDVNRWLNDLK